MDNVEVKQTAEPPKGKSLLDILVGRRLASEEDSTERVGPAAGVPIFALDALSSAAYGPEAALAILIPMGVAGLTHIVPISLTIIVLLSIVYFSYRQTIAAYPGGGGSYTVASENLGAHAGLLAGAALMIDYILNVAVGISPGVGAVASALPSLQLPFGHGRGVPAITKRASQEPHFHNRPTKGSPLSSMGRGGIYV